MVKRLVFLGLTFALALGREATANGTFAVTLADYNSPQVATNGYLVTVPYGFFVSGTTYSATYTITGGTSLQATSRFTITLPAGFTFNSQPSLSIPSGGATFFSGGIGSQTATFTITTNTIGKVYINEFAMHTPASFASQFAGNPVAMSVQATNNPLTTNDDPSPVSQPAFTHAVGSLPNTITPGSGQIDLAFPFYGNQFVPNGATTQGSGQVAVFAIDTELQDPFNGNVPVLSPNGQANSLSPSDTANITVSGFFNGIGTAYADPVVGSCQTIVPGGAIAGSVTPSSISFSGIPIDTPFQICIIPNGVMWENNQPYVYSYSAGAGVTDYFGGLSQTTVGNFYSYSISPNVVVLSGTPQQTHVNTAFGTALSVKVTNANTTPLVGVNVIFTPPALFNGSPSGVFGGGVSFSGSNGVGTDLNGIATAGTLTANSIACNYVVKASVATSQVFFDLQNEPAGVNDLIFCQGFQ